jgi:succinylglutamate desuccinylase
MITNTFIGSGELDILILTGVHGDEKTPLYLGWKLLTFVDRLKQSYNKLTIINAVNKVGIIQNTRELPNTHTNDLNRKFNNDSPDIFKELKSQIELHDVVIDIHSSPLCSEFILINQDEYANSYVEYALANDIKYLLRYSANDTIKSYCQELGKIAFTVEINRTDVIDVESALIGLILIDKLIDNIDSFVINEDAPKYKPYVDWTYYERLIDIDLHHNLGERIKTGQLLGSALKLSTLEKIDVRYNGIEGDVICMKNYSIIDPNHSYLMIQPVNEVIG